MTKKSSAVNEIIKKNVSKTKGAKIEKTLTKPALKRHTNGNLKTANKLSSQKRTQNTSRSKSISLKQRLAQREAELVVINSIQQGLAAELDFQALINLVGEKLRKILNTNDFSINWYNEKTNLIHYLYTYEHGKRLEISPMPPTPGGQFETMRQTHQPIVANQAADFEKQNIPVVPGTDFGKSLVSVPIISSNRLLGAIQVENHERENAYGESELRLLTTIAASLGTALENARLFDETQHLLKETKERNAELAIITSVQQGLASKLDMQAIYDLIGDKIRQIFDAQVVFISTLDRETNLNYLQYAIERGTRITVPP